MKKYLRDDWMQAQCCVCLAMRPQFHLRVNCGFLLFKQSKKEKKKRKATHWRDKFGEQKFLEKRP